jgi:hypothetical protein
MAGANPSRWSGCAQSRCHFRKHDISGTHGTTIGRSRFLAMARSWSRRLGNGCWTSGTALRSRPTNPRRVLKLLLLVRPLDGVVPDPQPHRHPKFPRHDDTGIECFLSFSFSSPRSLGAYRTSRIHTHSHLQEIYYSQSLKTYDRRHTCQSRYKNLSLSFFPPSLVSAVTIDVVLLHSLRDFFWMRSGCSSCLSARHLGRIVFPQQLM